MKQAYHHKDLRNALIDEAIASLADQNSGEITLRELARRLGVTHTAPYAHFADKKSLLEAIADEGFARLASAIDAAGAAEHDPRRRLIALGRAYLQFARDNPNLYRLMFADSELANDPDCDWSEDADDAFAILLKGLEAAGVPEGTDITQLALGVWSMVHGVAMLEIDRRYVGKTKGSSVIANGDEIALMLINYLLHGLHAAGAGS